MLPRDAPLMIWNDAVDLGALGTFPPAVHLRPRGARSILGIWTYDTRIGPATFPPVFAREYFDIVIRGLAVMIPDLAAYVGAGASAIVDGGYYCKAPDNRPLIGPTSIEGVYCSARYPVSGSWRRRRLQSSSRRTSSIARGPITPRRFIRALRRPGISACTRHARREKRSALNGRNRNSCTPAPVRVETKSAENLDIPTIGAHTLARGVTRVLHLSLLAQRPSYFPTMWGRSRSFSNGTRGSSVSGTSSNGNFHTPRARVCLGVVDSELDLEPAEIESAHAFGDLQHVGVRVSAVVQPCTIVDTDRFDDERIRVPAPDRVAKPRRVNVGRALGKASEVAASVWICRQATKIS